MKIKLLFKVFFAIGQSSAGAAKATIQSYFEMKIKEDFLCIFVPLFVFPKEVSLA